MLFLVTAMNSFMNSGPAVFLVSDCYKLVCFVGKKNSNKGCV